jgi:tetratricopeptide (TPR) repeat protein
MGCENGKLFFAEPLAPFGCRPAFGHKRLGAGVQIIEFLTQRMLGPTPGRAYWPSLARFNSSFGLPKRPFFLVATANRSTVLPYDLIQAMSKKKHKSKRKTQRSRQNTTSLPDRERNDVKIPDSPATPKVPEPTMKRRFAPFLSKALLVLILVLLCAGVVSYKLYLFNKLPFLDLQDGEGFFWTESAFHFRHFLMIAEGKDIPPIDYGIQAPEGLDTVRYITPVMERFAGTLYRTFFSDIAAHLYLPYFSILFSTFSVLAIYLGSKIVWSSNTAAFISALFYGFTPASLIRTSGGGFIREDFALPFIFFSFACLIYCFRKDRPLISAFGSSLLFVALAAWHVTQLYLSLFVVGMAVAYFVNRGEGLPQKSLLVFAAFMVTAAFLLPVLRAKYFILSPALMLTCGLLAALWFPALKGGETRKNFVVGGFLIVAPFVISLFIQKWMGVYSHVYELIFYKIKLLGVLPEDASMLSFEAKAMWQSAFVSPKWVEIPLLLCFSVLFGTAGMAIMIFRLFTGKAKHHEVMIVYFTVCTFVLFLMIHRMGVFAVFYLALSMGALTLFGNRPLKYAIYGCLGLCFLIQTVVMLDSFRLKAFRPNQHHLKNMIAFIRTKTDKEAAVLTAFELGPAIAVYTGHPVILHSKFESKILRDKVKHVYTSLFQREDEFYELCKHYKAGLFVYQINMALNGKPASIRYLVGATPLKTESAAFTFHFEPEKLKHFRLIYQNSSYRVFEIGTQDEHQGQHISYESIYDPDVFFNGKAPGKMIADGILEQGVARLRTSESHLNIGDRFFISGGYKTAVLHYERALALNHKNVTAAWALGKALLKTDEDAKAMRVFSAALGLDPDYDVISLDIQNTDIWLAMGAGELGRKRFDKAEKIFKKAIHLKPDLEEAYFGLGEALFGQEKLEEAKSVYLEVISFNPAGHSAYENIGKIYAAKGETAKAIVSVRKSLAINPKQPHLNKILRLLSKQLQKKKER